MRQHITIGCLRAEACPIAALVFLSFCIASVPVVADSVDEYVKQAMQKRRIPGLAFAVVRNGEIIRVQGYGVADLKTGEKVTPNTLFELASVTKQFTATAIMFLVEEGRIGLDDRISDNLPDAPQAWDKITVRHLLNHTSGLPTTGKGLTGLVWSRPWFSLPYASTEAMYDAVRRDPVGSAPGEKWQYSDDGYILLGLIIERVSGRTYSDFLAERIFNPLGMNSTVVENKWTRKNGARGYTIRGGKIVNIGRDMLMGLPSAHGIFASALDMAKWAMELDAPKLLPESSLNLMWTPLRLNDGKTYPYGFGWELPEWDVPRWRRHRMIGHNGITGTQITRFVDDGLTVVVLTNLGVAELPPSPSINAWGLTIRIASLYIPDLAYQPVEDKEPEFTELVKSMCLRPAEADWDQALFTPELWATCKNDLRHKDAYLKGLPRLETLFLVDTEMQGEAKTYEYRVIDENDRSFRLLLKKNREGKLSKLWLYPEP